jgi:hypothetical protein
MKQVVNGLFKFQREVYPRRMTEFQKLAKAQSPGCCSSLAQIRVSFRT